MRTRAVIERDLVIRGKNAHFVDVAALGRVIVDGAGLVRQWHALASAVDVILQSRPNEMTGGHLSMFFVGVVPGARDDTR